MSCASTRSSISHNEKPPSPLLDGATPSDPVSTSCLEGVQQHLHLSLPLSTIFRRPNSSAGATDTVVVPEVVALGHDWVDEDRVNTIGGGFVFWIPCLSVCRFVSMDL